MLSSSKDTLKKRIIYLIRNRLGLVLNLSWTQVDYLMMMMMMMMITGSAPLRSEVEMRWRMLAASPAGHITQGIG